MSDYSWPTDGDRLGERARNAWPKTIATLPPGTLVTGEVLFRQPFGVFIRIDGAPDAVGLAEIITMPREAELPAVASRVTGEVLCHSEHNYQVRIRLTDW